MFVGTQRSRFSDAQSICASKGRGSKAHCPMWVACLVSRSATSLRGKFAACLADENEATVNKDDRPEDRRNEF